MYATSTYRRSTVLRTLVGIIGVILLAGCGMEYRSAATSDDFPHSAPDFELTLFSNENHSSGEVVRLTDLEGRPIVLNFWFPSCPPCRMEMPDLERSFQTYKSKVEYIGVQHTAINTMTEGQDFILNQVPVSYAVGPDETGILMDYNIKGFPTTVFIDSKHQIVNSWTGVITPEKLEELVQSLIN